MTNILGIQTEFNINIWVIFAFLTGIIAGALLIVVIYLLIVTSKIHKSSVIITDTSNVKKEEIEEDIRDAQEDFLKVRKIKNEISWDDYLDINITLMKRIASRFYPESKKPLGELTLQECLLLDEYLVNKLNELLNTFGLKHFRKMKVNQIISLVNTSKKVTSNKLVKKGAKAAKILSFINVINPVTWINKGIVEPTINFMIKKILLMLIASVGQETYHIYSKDAFLDEVSEEEVDNIIKAIELSKEQDNEDDEVDEISDNTK